MPRILNNVINNIPSSGHSIYITQLDTFYELQTKFRGGYRVSKTSPTQSYSWDLYALGYKQLDRITKNPPYKDYYTKRFSTSKYFPLFCSTFSDNGGQNIYEPLPNFSGLSLLNHPKYSGYVYSGNFTFSPLLSVTRRNIHNAGENVIYRASYEPLLPIMVCSSIPTHKSYGPAFINSFNIGVDGTNDLGDVEISCSITGGRVLISPDNIPPFKPYTDGSIINLATIDPSIEIFNQESFNNFGDKYRPVNLSDCLFSLTHHSGSNAFANFVSTVRSAYSSDKMPTHKIVGMSLSVTQDVNFIFTYPGFSYLSRTEEFGDIVGPRFATLGTRRVVGSIKIFNPTNSNFINTNASSLTMFFGSYYFYSMKNVDWQQPVVTVSPGGGYIQEYSFAARMTEETYFSGLGNAKISEFTLL